MDKQLTQLEATSTAEVKAAAPGSVEARIKQLIDLKSFGLVSSLAWSTRRLSLSQSPPGRRLFG